MLVGGVVDHQFSDHPHAARMGRRDEPLGIGQRAVIRLHAAIVRDVVAIIAAWRGIERQQPDRIDAKVRDIVELGDQPGKIAHAIVVGVKERLDVKLVDDRVLVPLIVLAQRGDNRRRGRRMYGRNIHLHSLQRRDLPDGERQIVGIQANMLALASPHKTLTAHQVGGRE